MTSCLFCGNDVNPARTDRLVYEDDEKECDDCGATLIVGVDANDEIDPPEVDVYWTSASTCRHDKRHNDPCCLCEDEDGVGTGGDEP